MLGWHVSIFRQTEDRSSPATAMSPQGARLAVWQTGVDGLEWIDALVKAGKAIDLGGNGYPSRYTATAAHIIPQIVDMPPRALSTWMSGANDVLTDKWAGKTVIDGGPAADCHPDEWLLVEAWDES